MYPALDKKYNEDEPPTASFNHANNVVSIQPGSYVV